MATLVTDPADAPPQAPADTDPAPSPVASPQNPGPTGDNAPAPTAAAALDDSPEPRFHPLFPVEDAQRTYVDLMNMANSEALARCEALVRASEDPRCEAYLLLESADWRRKMVGVIWLLYHGTDRASRTLLWKAADGSWVSPQAAAVAFVLDRLFRTAAEDRLRAARAAGRPLSKALGALAGLYLRLSDGQPGLKQWLRTEAVYTPEGEWARGFGVAWLQRLTCLAPLSVKRVFLRWP